MIALSHLLPIEGSVQMTGTRIILLRLRSPSNTAGCGIFYMKLCQFTKVAATNMHSYSTSQNKFFSVMLDQICTTDCREMTIPEYLGMTCDTHQVQCVCLQLRR